VLGDKLDAGGFEDRTHPSEITRPNRTLAALIEPYHPFGEANSSWHLDALFASFLPEAESADELAEA
jgi:hypothetical protein